MNIHDLKQQLLTASKQTPADKVIKNARILDVFNLDWIEGDIAITNGKISGIGTFEGKEVIDAKQRYVCPSFIDGHVHIESSMVPPAEFSKVVLPHGVTTVITDPHEIANVSGTKGIQYMLDEAEQTMLDIFFMLPSCVPSTSFENAGAVLNAKDLKPFLQEKNVLGLAEVMDYPALASCEQDLIEKIIQTVEEKGKIDGHLAGLPTNAINIYRAAGIRSDHECNTQEDALERLRRGMYLLLREGSVAKDLKNLLPVVTTHNARRCLFCTDDKHLDDLLDEGSIDHHVRSSIALGLAPELAYQMASLNAAECYGLDEKGAIAPGYDADLLFISDLNNVVIDEVYKKGEQVAENGTFTGKASESGAADPSITTSVHFHPVTKQAIQVPVKDTSHIIEINPNQLATNKLIEPVDSTDGFFKPSIEKDLTKIVVVERHHQTGNVGAGILKGLSIKTGAIATTIAHDSHNIVAAGTNDVDLLLAIEHLKTMQGGLVIVKEGIVIADLPLTIAGLMSEKQAEDVYTELQQIDQAVHDIGFTGDFNPFLTLSFLTLPVIPALKMTDQGLFDVERFTHIEV
ncbi:adenine deaminase [Halobacillus fulvus]|nr:adenine deaminase [Halobacillus fulvus]